ncbi:MAG: SCO family protein [Actinomycetota bacterium]|nr:SCO family protein [Actinomycetota bacterium]
MSATPVSTDSSSASPAGTRFRPGRWYFVMLSVGVVLAGALAYIGISRRDAATSLANLRPSGIPANISSSTAVLMGLSPVPHQAAPSFSLVDQQGRRFSLSSFRHKVVVLEFMDPHCTDICPIVSQEFVDAYHDLGASAKQVVFMAVNVNRFHTQVSAVAAFSKEHRLDLIPSWHFFTGPVPELRQIWAHYGIQVYAPGPNADVQHSSMIYFINANGQERFIASPAVDHTKSGHAFLPAPQLTSWGSGIAQVAGDLLHS